MSNLKFEEGNLLLWLEVHKYIDIDVYFYLTCFINNQS